MDPEGAAPVSPPTPPPPRERQWRKTALRTAISALLILLLLWWADLPELLALMGSASLLLVAVLLVVQTVDRLLMAFKWWLLLEADGLDVDLWTAVRSYYISSFAGIFLPMTLGADAVRTLTLRGRGVTSRVVGTIALERGIGAVAQAMLCVVALVVLLQLELQLAIATGSLALLVVALLLVTSVGLPVSFRIADALASRLEPRGGFSAKLGALSRTYADARHNPRVVWTFLALTVLEGFFPIVAHWLASEALGLEVDLLLFVAIVPIVYLVGRLPISLGGIGVVEGFFALLGTALGIGRDPAVAIAILSQITMIVAVLPGAVAYVFSDAVPSGAGTPAGGDGDPVGE